MIRLNNGYLLQVATQRLTHLSGATLALGHLHVLLCCRQKWGDNEGCFGFARAPSWCRFFTTAKPILFYPFCTKTTDNSSRFCWPGLRTWPGIARHEKDKQRSPIAQNRQISVCVCLCVTCMRSYVLLISARGVQGWRVCSAGRLYCCAIQPLNSHHMHSLNKLVFSHAPSPSLVHHVQSDIWDSHGRSLVTRARLLVHG